MAHPEKGRGKFIDVHQPTLESTQVTSKVHNEAVETGCICGFTI